ncbi:MAG: PD40 domain-containing protein [Acidobacteria bacterium]|nr:PD40 domain-containing protein [Acidobacteriota bacterium]
MCQDIRSDRRRRTLAGAAAVVALLAGLSDRALLQEKKEGGSLPLESSRTVEFTTDEGSWISLDISPDGKTIVFELLGDLYAVQIGGGEARPIATGMAFDSQPRYSPDGSRIVFLSDRSGADNIWVANADGTDPRAITKEKTMAFRSPDWTPDGKYIVASRPTGTPPTMQLYLYHVDGGSGVKLTGNTEEQRTLYALGPAFGRDGRYVYFSERTESGSVYNQLRFRWQLGVYDRWTGENFRMSDELGAAMRPVLSPDGRWLVYATRWDAQTGLRARDLWSGDDAWLLYPVQRDDQESASTRDLMPGSSFTPDSKALVTSFDGKIWRVDVPSGDVSPIPFSATVQAGLGPKVQFEHKVDEGPVRVQQIRFPRLSPDGRRLAFTALNHVYVMDYPNGTPRRVSAITAGEHQPVWSPDARWIAYVTWSDEDGGHVYRVSAEGGPPQKLTELSSFYADPVYSPDGERVVVVRGPRMERQEDFSPNGRGGQARELIWLPAEGGATRSIGPYRGPGRPHFGATNDRIFVWEVRARSGGGGGGAGGGQQGTLVSLRWDGTDRRSHVHVTGYRSPQTEQAAPAAEVNIGPDGVHATAEAERHAYVITIPMVGGDPPTIALANPDNAAVPVKRLTTVGGEFVAWAENGKAVTFALGHAFFRYDLETAKKAEEAARAKETAEAAETKKDAAQKEGAEKKEPERKKPVYTAVETEVTIEVPRAKPTGTVVLRGARILTMRGATAQAAGSVIEKGDIVVTDNRIAAIGPAGLVRFPQGAKVIDVAGKTIMPGLVDVHAHIWPAWRIHKKQIWEYLANLAYGVTTTRDPQTATTDILAYRDLVETGEIIGPRVYGTGPGVFASDNPQSLDEARDVLRRYSRYWGTKTIKQYMVGNRQQRQWVIMAAKEQQLMPTLEGGLDLKLNLTQIMDGYPGLEHTLPITPLYKDVVKLAAESGVTYTPTLLVQYGGPWAENYFYEHTDVHADRKLRRFTPHADLDEAVLRRPWFHEQEYSFPLAARVAADIVKAGGRIGLGGHGQRQGIQCHWELWAIASGGLSPYDVLRVGTIFGAEAIGFGQDLGSIDQGKLADLVVLDRNPLENIRHTTAIRYVMKNGVLYEADTLDEIWPQQKKLPRQYWWDLEPAMRKSAPPRPTVTTPTASAPTNGR